MADGAQVDKSSLATQIDKAKQPKPLDHNAHPSLANTEVHHGVTSSPFLHQNQNQKEQIHTHHPSVAKIGHKVQSVKNMFEDKMKPFEHDHNASVYVLDEAQLAEKGIDYWENNRNHSRVDTQWWLNQLKMRKLAKQHTESISLQNTKLEQNPSSGSRVRINIAANIYKGVDENDTVRVVQTPSEEVEESVIEHSVIMNANYPPNEPQTPVLYGNDDLHEEYETLLEDYRYASKQILQIEREKQENMMVLNEQKDLITDQNVKIEELQRQLKVFEDAISESNKVNEQNNEAFLEKLEQNLALNAKNVLVSEQITNQITEKVNKNFKEQIHSMLDSQQKNENDENRMRDILSNEIKAKNTDIAMMKQRLNEKEKIESDLRNKLNDTKDEIINLQRNTLNGDKQNEFEILKLTQTVNEKEFENKQLSKSVQDLKYELQLERNMKRDKMGAFTALDQDDVKQNSVDEKLPNEMDETAPLLPAAVHDASDNYNVDEKQYGRTRRNNNKHVDYVGLKPKEYFLQTQWCCGFVCCDNACGCGSY